MKSLSKKAIAILSIFCLIPILIGLGISVKHYLNYSIPLSKSPKTTKFTSEDIKKFESEFSIKFPEKTRFIEAQYLFNFREPGLTLTFEIPIAGINTFLDGVNKNFKEIPTSSDNNNREVDYQSTIRQYTSIKLYPEDSGFRKVEYNYYRPSDDMIPIFIK